MTTEFLVLGPLAARTSHGESIELGGPRQRAVLARLLVAGGHVVPAERIVDDLWQGEPPPRALGALQSYVSHLRRALEPDRPPRAPARLLVSAPPGYALHAADGAVDAVAFADDLRAASTATNPGVALETAERALARWRGPAFADVVTEPWARDEAVRLEELRGRAHEVRASALLDSGRQAEAVAELEVLVGRDPLREEPWRLLALALYRAGRQGDALGALRRAREVMRDELGVDPGESLRSLEQAVLDQDPSLDAQRALPSTDAPVAVGLADRTRDAVGSRGEPGGPSTSEARRTVLVGRDAELARLESAIGSGGRPGQVRLALVAGEAGIGKSALVEEVAARHVAAGWSVAWGRCPETEGAPALWPWAEVVGSIAERIPFEPAEEAAIAALGEDAPDGTVASARFRMHRALADYLARAAGERPLLVVLDDLHRADEESLVALRFLAAHRTDAPLAVLVTTRLDEQREAVGEVAGVLAAHGGARIDVAGLDASAAAALVESVCSLEGRDADEDVVRALVERTAGNPFYVRESARLLASEGALVATHEVPAGVRDVVRRRLARLPATAQNVLRTVAVVGRSADVALVVSVDEHSEDEVYDGLESAVVAGLLDEPSTGVVRFTHALVRDTVFEDVPRLRRARRHADIAHALLLVDPDDASALAYHFGEATGLGLDREERDQAIAAGRQAASRFAYAAAADWWERALAAHDRLNDDDPAERTRLLMGLARAQQLAGRSRDARRTRLEAARAADALGDVDLLTGALIAIDVPMLWGSRDYDAQEDDGAYKLLASALERTGPGDPSHVVRLLAAMADELVHGVAPERAVGHAQEALALARSEAVDPVALAVALNAAYNTTSRPGGHDAMPAVAAELQGLGRDHDMPGVEAIGLLAEVSIAQLHGDVDRAERAVDAADQLARTYELPVVAIQAALARASVEFVRGDPDAAVAMARAATALPTASAMFDIDAIVPATILVFRCGARAAVTPEELVIAQGIGARYERFGPAVQALSVARAGDLDGARMLLDRPFDPLPDYMWLLAHAMRGEAAALSEHVRAAKSAYAALEPFADVVAGGETISLVFQPVATTLARLATTLGEPAAARTHWEQALDLSVRARAPRWERDARIGLDQPT